MSEISIKNQEELECSQESEQSPGEAEITSSPEPSSIKMQAENETVDKSSVLPKSELTAK